MSVETELTASAATSVADTETAETEDAPEVTAVEPDAERSQKANEMPRVGEAEENLALSLLRPVQVARGGLPVINDANGQPVYSEIVYGSSKVGVIVDSVSFSKSALGSRFSGTASPAQRDSHKTAFFIFNRLLSRI